jgi:sensor histidine kinase YesM
MASFAISEWGYQQSFLDAVIFELLFLPARLVAVYLNWFLLIPKILFRNRLGQYLLTLIFVLIIMAIAHRYFVLYWGFPKFFPQWMEGQEVQVFQFSRIVQNLLIIVSPVAFTSGLKLFMDWYKQRKETEELRQGKREAELKFLKAQTNPHFLFNTLNSIYGLALEKSEKTPSLILKLSDILSYTLYESGVPKVALAKEIRLIENIIALEKERFEKRVAITFEKKGDFHLIEVPPLLLVPLVENAFKHGVKNEVRKGWINITLVVDRSHLSFEIENSIPELTENGEDEWGLGLKNVSRRLELIYGEYQSLKIKKTDSTFLVSLEIKLKEKE